VKKDQLHTRAVQLANIFLSGLLLRLLVVMVGATSLWHLFAPVGHDVASSFPGRLSIMTHLSVCHCGVFSQQRGPGHVTISSP